MTTGAWRPERLREARQTLREHGRTVSQARFAELIGCSERSVERYEQWAVPKGWLLPAISKATDRPVEWFFETAASNVVDFEQALTAMLQRAIQTAVSDEFDRRATTGGRS